MLDEEKLQGNIYADGKFRQPIPGKTFPASNCFALWVPILTTRLIQYHE